MRLTLQSYAVEILLSSHVYWSDAPDAIGTLTANLNSQTL